MSDHTAGSGHAGGHAPHHAQRAPRTEFYLYFALIFMLAVPIAMLTWVKQLVVARRLPQHGPLARAWKDAGLITPEIFRP
jgi:hypothetical protein